MMRRTSFACIFLAWFLYFTWDGLYAPFGADDMMNIVAYWRQSPWLLLYSPLLLWRDFYRPMGGFFYRPIYMRFGLNPLPFHAVLLALLLVNAGLIYRLARLLGATRLASWLASMVAAYHAGLENLYWETAHVYDVLCSVFLCGSLICYARARGAGRRLNGVETATFFALALCALNSKEMSLMLPAMLAAYEVVYHPAGRSWRIPLATGLLSAVLVGGRLLRGLAHQPGYAVAPSWTRLLEFQQRAWRDLLLLDHDIRVVSVGVAWLVLTYLAFRRDRPILRFCWLFLVISPLPVEFLEGRGQAVLAVPLIGAAIFVSVIFADAAAALADGLRTEPLFGWFGRNGRLAIIVAAGLFVFGVRNRDVKAAGASWPIENGRLTAAVIEQFRALKPHIRPHSTVVFLNDPFSGFDMAFIAELWFRDRTLKIRLFRITPLTDAELARADYVFDYRDGRLLLLRSPDLS